MTKLLVKNVIIVYPAFEIYMKLTAFSLKFISVQNVYSRIHFIVHFLPHSVSTGRWSCVTFFVAVIVGTLGITNKYEFDII